MIGIVIVTHGLFGNVLIDTAETIIDNRLESVAAVSIDLKEHVEILRKKINNGIKEVSHNEGVLILTDMFGGTPSNLSYSFLEEGKIEVISGVNLPMLIKAVNLRQKKTDLHTTAKTTEAYGKKSISLASELVKGNKRE
ncbi:MAG: PTS fructose transporter subunit IIA [Desulfosalsimonadaceae bacterium]